MNGAVQYNHICERSPTKMAGAKERTGFMDAPETRPKKYTSKATAPAIKQEDIEPFCLVYMHNIIVEKRMAVARISTPKTTYSENARFG